MVSSLSLESFDGQHLSQTEHPENIANYDDGFRDGQEAANLAHQSEQSQLRAKVAESLVDGMFGYEEAQSHFSNGTANYVTAILEQVLPELLAPALHLKVRQLLQDAIERDSTHPFVLRLPPNQIDVFQAVISDLDLSEIVIEADPALTEHAAFFMGGGHETSIDFDALHEAIKHHSKILITPAKEAS